MPAVGTESGGRRRRQVAGQFPLRELGDGSSAAYIRQPLISLLNPPPAQLGMFQVQPTKAGLEVTPSCAGGLWKGALLHGLDGGGFGEE